MPTGASEIVQSHAFAVLKRGYTQGGGSAFASVRNGKPFRYSGRPCRHAHRNVAALERRDNVAESGHAFAVLKRGNIQNSV